ncbi:MAG TPA: APC family permease [Bryobacteraceae bacterium]
MLNLFQTDSKHQLHRVLGVAFGLAVTVGTTIGAGILRRPGAVAELLRTPALILGMWLAGGLYGLLGAINAAELGTMIPKAGGFFVWTERAFGRGPGFVIGWCDFLGNCASLAYAAITLVELAAALVPALLHWTTALAIAVVLVFAAIQAIGVKAGARTQEWTTILLAATFLSLVAAAFWFGGAAERGTPIALPPASRGWIAALILAFQSIVVTYDGWYEAAYFAEEDKEPSYNLPRSMIGGVLSVTAIYLAINAALLYVLPIQKLAGSEFPASDAAKVLFGSRGATLVTLLSMCALPSLINSSLLGASRILFALGRTRLFWRRAAEVNKGGTPWVALACTTGAGIVLVLSGTFERLLAMAGVFYVVLYCSAFASLLVLRKKEPQTPRPFPVWGYPWTTLIVLIGGLGFLVGAFFTDTANSIEAIAFMALSAPVYWIFVGRRETTR